jgi:hypothetical protein
MAVKLEGIVGELVAIVSVGNSPRFGYLLAGVSLVGVMNAQAHMPNGGGAAHVRRTTVGQTALL